MVIIRIQLLKKKRIDMMDGINIIHGMKIRKNIIQKGKEYKKSLHVIVKSKYKEQNQEKRENVI
jgi:hypothetical protein